jgi:phosphohistidine swiveling domain-containing protein
MTDLRTFADITPADLELVGGKGLSLGLMAAAGLPVPPGFCVTTTAYRRAHGAIGPDLLDALTGAYHALGAGPVAVRSSATAEDGAATSFAGQQETILGVEGEPALKTAVERCWSSLHTERAKAYRQKQGVDEAGLAMAVVVQRLVHADVAGVLFTRDPNDPAGATMLVEASWGLGEAVVSGRVTPDAFQLDRATGTVRERRLGAKGVRITARGEEHVSPADRERYCLDDGQLAALAELGRRVEDYYGAPRDVEWAFADGRFWLLQARPITTAGAADREQVRREEIAALQALADPAGTVWSRTNLVEVLPEPTPLTWTVVRALLSGGGGSGMMYRDFGFAPDPALADLTVYDLVGGRPYCNLGREPRLQAKRPLFGYPFALYKQQPAQALDPKPDTSRMLGGFWKFLRLPGVLWNLIRTTQRIQKAIRTFADEYRTKIAPAFRAEVAKAAGDDLSRLDPPALLERFRYWVKRTLVEFARDSLKPTLFAQFSMQVLEQQLKKPLGPERTRAAVAELSAGAHADEEADLPAAIRDLAAGTLAHDEFLKRFGHRGSGEMELARPRWGEDPASLDRLLGAGHAAAHFAALPTAKERWDAIAAEAKLNSFVAGSMAGHVERLQTYLGLRETAKNDLMRGYALIRQALVELDRRAKLNGGIFFLMPEELPGLVAGQDLTATIDGRRKRRAIALSLEVPPVLFSDDLDAIGRPQPAPEGAAQLQGLALSAGVAEGPALVLTEPAAAPGMEAYILVCPSTDPAWVPLFVGAKGLVMESGGALSHGAIVAREFGLPAVAGLPGVQRQIKTGQRLRVDGGRGTVTVLG